jgi:CIC family chloride channel protein
MVQIILKGSVHTKHLEEQGFQIQKGRERNLLKSIIVSDVKLTEIELIPDGTVLPELVGKLLESPQNTFYTINESGKINGIITETELRPLITEYEQIKDVIVARDIMNPMVISVSPDDDLDFVLNLFGKWNLDQIPVISTDGKKEILGAITRQEVIEIYNRESRKLNLASGLTNELKLIEKSTPVNIAADHSISEENVPLTFIGKTLVELKIRSNFGLEVLMIKQHKDLFSDEDDEIDIITPDPNYKLKRTDSIVLFGLDEKIEDFRKLSK